MSKNDESIERDIQAAGKTAPRVTHPDLLANIVSSHYFTASEAVLGFDLCNPAANYQVDDIPQSMKLLTFCVLVLRNGFTVTGESACASPENFDAEIGRKIARQNAEAKIWPLLGYQLKQRLYQLTTRDQHLEAAAIHVSAANALQTGK